jgi:hypothetical protein
MRRHAHESLLVPPPVWPSPKSAPACPWVVRHHFTGRWASEPCCVTPNAAVLHPARTQGDAVGVKVQKLSSTKTQLPYEYYSLPFCKPAEIVNSVENLGEVCALLTTSGGRRRMLRLGYSVDTRKLDTRARRLLAFLQVLRGDRIENSVFVVRSPLPSAPTHDSAVG